MKYYVIAGETSGDLHGANLIHALKEKDTAAEFRIVGGDRMQTASGNQALIHTAQMAFMGRHIAQRSCAIWLYREGFIAH